MNFGIKSSSSKNSVHEYDNPIKISAKVTLMSQGNMFNDQTSTDGLSVTDKSNFINNNISKSFPKLLNITNESSYRPVITSQSTICINDSFTNTESK